MGLAHVPSEARARIEILLEQIYGRELLPDLLSEIDDLLTHHARCDEPPPTTAGPLTEEDVFLIAYPDMLHAGEQAPLSVLHQFLQDQLAEIISGVHLLPFFPASSDDGFSVIDYRQVDTRFGDWSHIESIASSYRLMADTVINHVSKESDWFQAFIAGEPPFTDYFLTVDPAVDLSDVVRPRDLPLLTEFSTLDGPKFVWTTFSDDQVDLNYRNPQVLIEVLKILMEYVRHGVQVFRLDAVAFLWKEAGTPSIHLRETHLIIQLMRAVLEVAAPWSILITETNVPHEQNVSYFGNGQNEAHLVYQFPLPPLVLYALHTGDTEPLVRWLRRLHLPSPHVSFLNFLASHDGVGLRPAQDILPKKAADELVRLTQASGGGITYRQTGPGGKQPYELNVSYLDALARPGELARDAGPAIQRFLCAHALLLGLQGIPALYFHSLFGSRNDTEGVASTGRLRSINRQKLELNRLLEELRKPNSIRRRVFEGMSAMLQQRQVLSAFHPHSAQEIVDLPAGLVGIRRLPHDGAAPVTVLLNATSRPVEVNLPTRSAVAWYDLLGEQILAPGPISLESWDYRWLQEAPPGAEG